MNRRKSSIDNLLSSLQERAKELECYYAVQDILAENVQPIETICERLIEVIPPGWQYPDLCQVRVLVGTVSRSSPDFTETPWAISADIVLQNRVVGYVSVCYAMEVESSFGRVFLPEETRLLQAIAERLGHHLRHRLDRQLFEYWETALRRVPERERSEWQIALETVQQTDPDLYRNVSRKMLNFLCWSGIKDAEPLLRSFHPSKMHFEADEYRGDWNTPREGHDFGFTSFLASRVYSLAADHLDDAEIMGLIQKWVREDKQSFLIQLVNPTLPTSTMRDIIRRYYEMSQEADFVPIARTHGVLISLIRRFLSEDTNYVSLAKNLLTIGDFHELLGSTIHGEESHGRLGGKAAGLYLACQIVREKAKDNELLRSVRSPKTWVVTSEVLYHFVHHCSFDELVDQKYKPIQQVRLEYPSISQAFKSVPFPTDIVRGLSAALDDFGTNPIIVRSSSLLEDSVGATFSGKYLSLFLANQGSKRRRLEALIDAVAEVYASTFGPDPIEYRSDRGLLDYSEEMGILIQEVVGQRVGKYFFPAYAGVAFGRNEYRWSPRIKREDGLVRVVPGLGTRAVDRTSNDYPVLLAPGKPDLRPNVSPEEKIRYAPREIDVLNLESETLETLSIDTLLREIDYDYPQFGQVFSANQQGHIRPIGVTGLNSENEEAVATFNGLIGRSEFVKLVQSLMTALEESLGFPVDIEFASDGKNLYLLQCRAQSSSDEGPPVLLPKNIPDDHILFTAQRTVPNGCVTDITYVVYVDPERYGKLAERSEMMAVAQAVSQLNEILPKRSFVLMGPGRWGSRGDISLGVPVEYSDINNTAMLIEIARAKGDYVPELSYGTHFFQDLVEARIRYLPLYPDQDDTVLNEAFISNAPNLLPVLLPDFAHLKDTLRVINVTTATRGLVMCVAMNADQNHAVAFFTEPNPSSKEQAS